MRSANRAGGPRQGCGVSPPAWVDDSTSAMFTDLYQLTMMQSYVREGLQGVGVFDLFVRRLPPRRNFLIAAGLGDVLSYLETFRFPKSGLDYLSTLEMFSGDFLNYLEGFRFTGDVYALPEGTVCFAQEPILEIVAPLPQGQLIETFVLNQIHHQTMVASKGARVVRAAEGRPVVDFGMRRMHGTDAAMKGARALYLAGADATSNVLAGHVYGIPVSGTMAHSYIEAHDEESEAFRQFNSLYPGTVLLVDTYDTVEGVRRVARLAREASVNFKVSAIRLDSGDLAHLAHEARKILDESGLSQVEIFASGSLDEETISSLVAAGAPIDGFGVGTRMGVSADAPYIDSAYKLVEYGGRGRLKRSPDKKTWPGRKQVFRVFDNEEPVRDVIGLSDERSGGRPLLEKVMEGGRRIPGADNSLDAARNRCAAQISRLPQALRNLEPAVSPYPVTISAALEESRLKLTRKILDSK